MTMTPKEKALRILTDLPEEVFQYAYSLNVGTNENYAQMEYSPEVMKVLAPATISTDNNGYVEFHIEADGKQFRITMTW